MTKNDYFDDQAELAGQFNINESSRAINRKGHRDLLFQTLPFNSSAGFVYPEEGDYGSRGGAFTSLLRYYCNQNRFSSDLVFNSLQISDREISENMSFRIPVYMPCSGKPFSSAIIMLHGLNEKHWEKYLAWAARLAEDTGRPVIMFPIAFHMNRAPESWGSPRQMIRVAAERKKLLPECGETSFVNAALSHRIQFAPHRFFSSGLQTYYDIISFIEGIRLGLYPILDRNCIVDFFGYSIGASLGEILLTGGHEELTGNSKLFIFCGGAVLDTASPVSRSIIDAEAYTELFSWFSGLFETITDAGRRMKQLFLQDLPEVLSFKSFLFYNRMQSFREEMLRRASGRIRELSLEGDMVFPPTVTSKTLHGSSGDIGIRTEHLDFPFNYSHEDPFPLVQDNRQQVNDAFNSVFSRASGFFGSFA